MEQAKINRINALAAKKRDTGLTPEETAEQAALRAEYLAGFRKNLEAQLDSVYILDEDGCERKLQKRGGESHTS